MRWCRNGMWRSMIISFAIQTTSNRAVVIVSIFTVDKLGAISAAAADAAATPSAKGHEDHRIFAQALRVMAPANVAYKGVT